MATQTITENQRRVLAGLVAGNGKLPAESVDTRSASALEKKGMVSIVELKKGKQVRVTAKGRKALN